MNALAVVPRVPCRPVRVLTVTRTVLLVTTGLTTPVIERYAARWAVEGVLAGARLEDIQVIRLAWENSAA